MSKISTSRVVCNPIKKVQTRVHICVHYKIMPQQISVLRLAGQQCLQYVQFSDKTNLTAIFQIRVILHSTHSGLTTRLEQNKVKLVGANPLSCAKHLSHVKAVFCLAKPYKHFLSTLKFSLAAAVRTNKFSFSKRWYD